jgi:hypothetical protein
LFTSPKKIERAMRIARALHLRGLGFTYAEIGDEMGSARRIYHPGP